MWTEWRETSVWYNNLVAIRILVVENTGFTRKQVRTKMVVECGAQSAWGCYPQAPRDTKVPHPTALVGVHSKHSNAAHSISPSTSLSHFFWMKDTATDWPLMAATYCVPLQEALPSSLAMHALAVFATSHCFVTTSVETSLRIVTNHASLLTPQNFFKWAMQQTPFQHAC